MLPDALSKSSEDLDELRPRQHVDVYVPARERHDALRREAGSWTRGCWS